MSYGPATINDLLRREWCDFIIASKVAPSVTDTWFPCLSENNNQCPLCIFNPRKTEQFSTREGKKLTKRRSKESIGIIYYPLLLRSTRIKADSLSGHLSRMWVWIDQLLTVMFAVSFQDTVTTSHSHLISVLLLAALTSLISINRGKI